MVQPRLHPDRWVCWQKALACILASALILEPTLVAAGVTQMVSVGDTGQEGNGPSAGASMSGDGALVIFSSAATDLTGEASPGVFSRAVGPRTTSWLTAGTEGAVSSDGAVMAYVAEAGLNQSDLFLRPVAGAAGEVQVDAADPRFGATNSCASPALDVDGSTLVFAANRYIGDVFNIYTYDSGTGVVDLVSESTTASYADADCERPAVSLDGRYVVFRSAASNLVAAAGNGFKQVFLWDRSDGGIVRISSHGDGSPAAADCSPPAISGDGSRAAFSCADDGLVAGDGNGAADTYLYDVGAGTLALVSTAADGAPGGGHSSVVDAPSLSQDGQKVLFVSAAANLAPDDTNGQADVFLKDVATGAVTLVSRSSGGLQAAGPSGAPALSLDGTRMAFESGAGNLVPGDYNGQGDVFLHDAAALYNNPQSKGMNPARFFTRGSGRSRGAGSYNVNTATLNMAIERRLFHMRTRGPDVDVTLYYNADPGASPGPFGRGWSLGQDWTVHPDAGGHAVVLRTGTGREMTFTSDVNLIGPVDGGGMLIGVTYPLFLTSPGDSQDRLELTQGSMGGWFFMQYHERSTRHTYWFNDDWYTYSGTGILERIEDAYGNGVYFNHDGDKWPDPTKVILADISVGHDLPPADTRTISFTYDAEGLCTRIDAPAGDGRFVTMEHDAAGNMTRLVDMAGYENTYEYDAEHYMTRQVNDGKSVTFDYQSRGPGAGKYLSRVTDGGAAVDFAPAAGNVTRTSPGGRTTTFTSNDRGKTTRVVDPMGRARDIGYDGDLPDQFTDTGGKTNRVTYDAEKRVSRLTDAEGNVFDFEYDADGNLTRKTTPDGAWNYTYNDKGQVLTARSPLDNTRSYAYDGFGQVTSVTDARGNSTDYAWDNFGNVVSVTDALGETTTYAMDPLGLRCTTITDATGKVKSLEHDGNDRLTRVVQESVSGSPEITYAHDAFHVNSVTDENGHITQVTRNALGYITSRLFPLGNEIQYVYDADSRQTEVVDALGRVTSFDYDDSGRLVEKTDPAGFRVGSEYDGEGNLARITDPRSSSIQYGYDGNNNLVETTYANGRKVTIARDAMGRIGSLNNGRGQTVAFGYDADGRMTSRTLGGGGTSYAYAYDGSGNMTQVSGASETTSIAYTDRDEVASIQYPDGKIASFQYDAAGNLSRIDYPGGPAVTYTYDDFNRVAVPDGVKSGLGKEAFPDDPKPRRVTRMTWSGGQVDGLYDAAARLTRMDRGNGTVTLFGYDSNDRLVSVDHRSGTSFAGLSYGYDAADQTLSLGSTHALAPQLSPLAVTASHNNVNQIALRDGGAYSYDNDGNLLSGGPISGGAYDAENRLLQITKGGGTVVSTYDGIGRRAQRTAGGQTVRYHYDAGGRLLFETVGTSVTARYFYMGESLAAMERSGAVYYYHFDRNGNTLALTDAAGAVVNRYAYGPGGLKTTSGAVVENPFTFVGRHGVVDDGNGLYSMGRRHYDADLGRFLQYDPAGVEGGLNLYAYAANNPVDRFDPEGEAFVTTLFAIGWGVTKVAALAVTAYGIYKAGQSLGKLKKVVDKADASRGQADTMAASAYANHVSSKRTKSEAFKGLSHVGEGLQNVGTTLNQGAGAADVAEKTAQAVKKNKGFFSTVSGWVSSFFE